MADELLRTVHNIGRLAALYRTGLLDTPPEETFDRFTRLASKTLSSPIALISLVDQDRQFFKSAVGLSEPWASARGTPLSHSFCRHAVESGNALIVCDARVVPLVRDNPAVREMGIIAYAGMPLQTSDGYTLGTLCVVDDQPHVWSDDDVEVLRELGACLTTEIELRTHLREAEAARREAEGRLQEEAASRPE